MIDRSNWALIKLNIIKLIRNNIEKDLLKIRQSAEESKKLANADDMKQESKYDTRKTEANYITSALNKRVLELESDLLKINKIIINEKHTHSIKVGDLILCKQNGILNYIFLSPTSGGQDVSTNGLKIKSICVLSPLGEEFISLGIGDDFEFETPCTSYLYEILDIY